jgi:oligogalacturonide transport system substrate-binding protein
MKKVLIVLLALILVLGVITGCAPAPASDQNAPDTTKEQATESTASAGDSQSAEKPVTLRFMWWGGDERHEATLAAIDLYKEKTGITIQAEYQGWDGYEQKMMTQLASGTAPDIIQLDSPWLLNLTSKDLFVELTGNEHIDFSQFDQDFLDKVCMANNQLIGLPTGVNAFRLVANKNILDKAGVDISKQYTWDERFELGKKLHDASPDDYLMFWDPGESWYFFENYIYHKTGDFIIGDDYTVHAPKEAVVEALTKLKEMYTSGTSLPLSEVQPFSCVMDTNPLWISGNIGGCADYTSKITIWQKSSDNPIVTMNIPIPTDSKALGEAYRPAQLWGVPKCSENQEAAIKFINWALTDPEAAMLLGTVRSVPAAKSAADTLEEAGLLDPVLVDALEKGAANKAPAAPVVIGDGEINAILMDAYQKVVYDDGTIEEVAQDLITRLQARLDEMKG